MARISNFPLDDNVGLNDILVGSEYNGIGANNRPIYVTKNYRIGDLSNFFGLNADTVAVNANKLSSLATFNADGSLASLQNATISLINTATTGAGFATASSVTAVGSRVDVIMPGGGSTVSEAFANQIFTTTTNSDFAASSEVTEIKSQFTYNGTDINGLASGTIISTAIATAETSAVSTADTARATAETALVATISKVFRQDDAPAVTEPVNSIWYDTNDNNKSYVLVAGTPRVWTYTVDATLATSASVTQVSDTAADINGNLSASHSLMVNAGGAIAGMKVSASTSDTGVSNSNVVFLADQFTIKTASGTKQPFTVSNDVVSIDGTLKIGSSTASSIVTKANSATQASDHATIQAGTTKANVGLGNVDNTNDATVRAVAAATSGTVAGWNISSYNINSGASANTTQSLSGYAAANAGITMNYQGSIHAPNFYINSDGSAGFRGTLTIGSTDLTSANALNENTSKSDVGLGNVDNTSDADIQAGTTAANVGLGNVNNTSDATVLNNAATASNTQDKDAGSVGGWTLDSNYIYSGTLQTSDGYSASGITLYSGGALRAKEFYIANNGDAFFKGDISAASGTFTGDLSIGSSNSIFKATTSGIQLGHATFGSAPFRVTAAGVITASSGTIGGWTLGTDGLRNGRNSITSTTAGVFIGQTGIALGATGAPTFKVTAAGVLTATSGSFTGSISGASGTFAGVTINSNGIAGSGFTLNANGLAATSGSFTGVVNATSGSFAGSISAATGTFGGGVSGTGYTLDNSGLQLDNASSVINIGNSVVLSSGGLVGQGFELTSTGIEASSGIIGGWSIGSNLTSSDGTMSINPATNSIQISEGSTVRVDINSSTTVSDPEQTGSVTGVNSLSYTNTQPSTQSGNISYSSGKNVYIYSSDKGYWTGSTLANKTVQYSISMAASGYTVNVSQGSGVFVGTMSCTAGLAFSTSTSSSGIFHYTSSATASRSGGGSASISSTTVSGTFVWPNQSTVYVFGWNKNVSVSGTNYSGEPPSGPQTATISFRTPYASPSSSNITLTISKCELVSGGLLVAKDTSNFFRVNRNGSTSYTNPFITSKGRITHYGNIGIGGNIKLGIPSASSTQFAMIQHNQGTTSALLLRNYSTGGIHFRNSTNSLSLSINNDRSIKFDDYGSGTLTSNNSGLISSSSDGSLKDEVIQDIPGLSEVLRLNPKAYIWKNDTQSMIEIGFFANEVKDVIPEAAPLNNNGLYGLLDRGIIAALVKGMKEQQAIIESQKTLIDNLTERVTALEG